MRVPLETAVFTYGDYRSVNGIDVTVFDRAGDEGGAQRRAMRCMSSRYDVLRRERDADFANRSRRMTRGWSGGVASTTVPMMLEGRQLMIWASIDGHAPMPFILDTGGHAILTTQAAQTLGLASSGAGESGGSGAGKISTQYTHVESVRVGAAELLDQPFLVIPYPYSFYERGKSRAAGGDHRARILRAFCARLDYGARTVTSRPLDVLSVSRLGDGRAVHL